MQTTTVKLYSMEYNYAKTYWIAVLFVAGNIFCRNCAILFRRVASGGCPFISLR